MKIKQETVAFIHSVKAKLLLMGGVAIASVGILSIILVNMLGLVNKDAQLISQINEVNQIQYENNSLSIEYYYTLSEEKLIAMSANLERSQAILNNAKRYVTLGNRANFDVLKSGVSKSVANYKQIIELSSQRGFSPDKALYAEFLKNDNQFSQLVSTKFYDDKWVETPINAATMYYKGDTRMGERNHALCTYSGTFPKKVKREYIVLRLGSRNMNYSGMIYINNVELKKGDEVFTYPIENLKAEDLVRSYGSALQSYEIIEVNGKASIGTRVKFNANSGSWQDCAIYIPVNDLAIEEYDSIRFDVYCPSNNYSELNIGSALDEKVNIGNRYTELNNSFINYSRAVANGNDVSSHLEQLYEAFNQIQSNVDTYVSDSVLHKEIQELLDEKLAVFNTIVDNDKTILDYKYDNAHIKANMEAATAAMKTDIENAMTGRKRVATVVAIITSILVIGVICAATLLITKNINTSLAQFGKVLEELSSGNLQVRACIVAQDEFGTFSIQLNQFVAKLANVLEDIQLLINEVGNKNLVVGNTMKHVARGDTEEGEANDGVLYLQKMFQEVSDNVMTQSTNTEESVAAINEQLETNTGILTSINKLKEYLGTTTMKVADIKKDMEELGSDKKLATETTKIIERLSQNISQMVDMAKQSSTDLEVICSSIDNQNASLQEVTSAVEQISEEGIKILDKINETSTFAQAISQELIDGVDTIEEVIESSEKLREEIAFFKI